MTTVFDTSAVLAVIFLEPGGDQVPALWADGENLMSAVNYAELVAKLSERGMSDAEVLTVLEGVPLTLVDFDQTTAHASGLLRKATRAMGLSLGDRACIALGQARRAKVVTADKLWQTLSKAHIDVDVHVIR
jgi:ribonuclease VapC